MSKTNTKKGDKCRNCQAELSRQENFCPQCGQKNDVRRLTIGEYISESMGNFFSFDSKITQSLIPFFVKPGILSRKYIDGEKARFVVPFRMYMFFSVLFFLVAGFSNKIEDNKDIGNFLLPDEIFESEKEDSIVSITKLSPIPNDSLGTDSLVAQPFAFPIYKSIKYARKNPDSSTENALKNLGVFVSESTISSYEFWTKFLRMDQRKFVKGILDKLPLLIFLFMPFLACALKFFYIRHDIFYSEHLTFLLQSNSMVFLLATMVILIKKILGWELGVFAFIFFSIYFLVAMKNFYRQGWFKTIIKYMLLGWSYLLLVPIFGVLSLLFFYYFFDDSYRI